MFSFPNPVNEKAARVVAGCVLVVAIVALVAGWHWLLLPLAIGFWLRVLFGPRLSPFALFATRVAAPRLGPPKEVPGPPKRFAQGMGAAMTTAGAVLATGFEAYAAADVLLAALILAAGLESIFALCLGCHVFSLLMRLGLIPQSVCAECEDISGRLARAQSG